MERSTKMNLSSALRDSVNDIEAEFNYNRIESFRVANATWSDHFPISIVLEFEETTCDLRQPKRLLPKLSWIYNRRQKYCKQIDHQLEQSRGITHGMS